MSKKSFKPTPIIYRTKNGEPMSYYILSEDGNQHTKVTRAECLAHPVEYDTQYPQRWFVDEESGLVVRLPRNVLGENIARENMRSIWREEKYQERRYACLFRGTEKCDGWRTAEDGTLKCDRCQRQNVSRTVELDMHFGCDTDGEDSEGRYEPADDCDIAAVSEDSALLDTLHSALIVLTQEDRDLITDIFCYGKTERQLAPQLGLKEPKSVNKRKHRILEILRQNEALKSFFE